MKTRNFKTMLTAIALTIAAPLAMAADSATPTTHNPYTVLGVQLRSVLLADPANGSSGVSLGPAIFQEIVPCRFISTLEADRYPIEWGGPAYAANESRSYRPIGEMVSANFTNPCSLQVPVESLAVAARVWATGTKSTKSVGNTVVWLTPGHDGAPADKLSKIALIPGEQSMNEASVVLKDKMFTVTSQAGGADLVVDIIGYFIADPYLNGAQGPKGDRGDIGPAGPAGAQGAQGLQGEKGERGEQGLDGKAGAEGKAGADGKAGAQGERGADGKQGEKGDRGEQGLKGEKGDHGEQGLKGDRGEQGATGATGATGAQGPQGIQGLQGPPGSGAWVSGVYCMGQGENSVVVNSSAIHTNSAILVTVVGRSLGNTISVLSASEGSATISGKPATCFRIVVFN